MLTCPNKSHPDWIAIVEKYGEERAYLEYVNHNYNIPALSTIEEVSSESISDTSYLDNQVRGFLRNNGISIENVESILDTDGKKLPVSAVADATYKVIQVVNGQQKEDTLPEEAGHIMIEMLGEQHPLYQSMYNEITSYDIYNDVVNIYSDLYNNNDKMLRKEAMAKLISKVLTGEVETKKQERANRWWNRVLRFLKEKVASLIGIEDLELSLIQYDPFSQAADMILSQVRLEDNSNPTTGERYYQVDRQSEIIDRLKNKHQLVLKTGDDRYTRIVNGQEIPVKKRVSDRVKQAFAGTFTERTEVQKAFDEIKAKYGTKGHADIANIIDRTIALREGKIAPARQPQLNAQLYNTLEVHFNQFINQFDPSTRFLTEVTIYDEQQDEAGTIDLLAIHNDGTASIYDWKFIDFNNKGEIPWYKRKAFNIQLPRYKEMLQREYGISNIRQMRVIPIAAEYKRKELVGVKIGNLDIKKIPSNQEYLKPLPMFEEMTGKDNLDRLLQGLIQEKEEIEKSRPATSATAEERALFNDARRHKLDRVSKAIQEIQLTNDIQEYVNIGLDLIRTINDGDVTSMNEQELHNLIKTLKFYGQDMIKLIGDVALDKSKPYHDDISKLATNAQIFENQLSGEIMRRVIEREGAKITEAQKEPGVWSTMFRSISQQKDPIIQAFWGLVKKSKAKVSKDFNNLNNQIAEAIQGLREAQPNKSGVDLFDFMLRTTDNGQLQIVPKYSSEFYAKLSANRAILSESSSSPQEKAKAAEWIRKYTTHDTETYKKWRAEYVKQQNQQYRFDVDKAAKVKRKVEEWDDRNGTSLKALGNPKNYFLKLNEDETIFSDSYKVINSDARLKKFYDLWMKHSNEFQDYIGRDLGGRFVWNVPKTLVDSITENGISGVTNLQSISEHFLARPGQNLGMIDPRTGKPQYSIPAYYTELNRVQDENGNWVVDSSNQSRNLGTVLSLVGAMAYNHKYMGEIETNARSLELILQGRETILTNPNGQPLLNKITGKVQKLIGASSSLEQFQDYMNYYIYGVNNKSRDFLFGKDNQYSALAVYNFLSKTFVAKALSFNPVSIVANSVGGEANARIIGAKNIFFNNSDYSRSQADLAIRDKKSWALVHHFDLINRDNPYRKAKRLDVNGFTKVFTYDNLFIGQELGDWAIRNPVLLAMLKSHTYDGTTIRKITSSEKGAESLFDRISIKNDQLDLGNIPEDELERFRTKALAVGDNILGNNSRDDIRRAQLTIMGRALMMFRSWIPRTVDERFGELRHNIELDTYELGRYKSFWNQVVNKQFIPRIWEMIRGFGVFGYGGRFGDTTINHAKRLYAEAIYKNPQLGITEQEYIDLHLANLKAMMMEVYITGLFITAIMSAAPDDDETLENGSLRKYFYQQMSRNLSELAFYYNPTEFNKILRSPVPITRLATDLVNLGQTIVFEGVETVTGDEDLTKPNDLRKYSFRIFPVLSGFESILSFVDEDYDKTQSQIDNPRQR